MVVDSWFRSILFFFLLEPFLSTSELFHSFKVSVFSSFLSCSFFPAAGGAVVGCADKIVCE